MHVNGVCDIASLIRANCRLGSRYFRITRMVVAGARLTSCLWDQQIGCGDSQFATGEAEVTHGDKRVGLLVLGFGCSDVVTAIAIVTGGTVAALDASVADNDLCDCRLDRFHGCVGRREL
jgi:heme A synthase